MYQTDVIVKDDHTAPSITLTESFRSVDQPDTTMLTEWRETTERRYRDTYPRNREPGAILVVGIVSRQVWD